MDMDFNSAEQLAKTPEEASSGVFPIFHHETRLDQEKTNEIGKNVYKKVPYVEIVCPGNDKERLNRAVIQEDKDRWPKQWQRFQEGDEELEFDGMPLTEWAGVDEHLSRTLKESNIFTVEQLAEVADIDIQMLGMGMVELKNRAKKWVKTNAGQDAELKNAQAKIAQLETAIKKLQERPAPEAKLGETEAKVEPVVKNGGWYTFRGEKYRYKDLPPDVQAMFEE